jgi:hypothetical protein
VACSAACTAAHMLLLLLRGQSRVLAGCLYTPLLAHSATASMQWHKWQQQARSSCGIHIVNGCNSQGAQHVRVGLCTPQP